MRSYVGQAFYLPTRGAFRWPRGLEEVEFGSQFDGGHFSPGDLPPTPKRVKFGEIFNTHLGKALPEKLEVLTLGMHYVQSLHGASWLPGLIKMTVGCRTFSLRRNHRG